MSRACIIVTLIALSTGCRERNPQWLGPASDTSTSSETSATATGSTTASSSGGETTSAESSTGGEPIPCNNDNQCPDGLVCGPQGCQAGNEGEPCDRSRDCGEMAPICSSAGICQDGSAGDPCSNPGDCATACEGEVCVDDGGSSTAGTGSTG